MTTETRHYIGVTPLGRLHVTLGPDEPDAFALPPTEPMQLRNGTLVYPVSAEVAEEWDFDEDEAVTDSDDDEEEL